MVFAAPILRPFFLALAAVILAWGAVARADQDRQAREIFLRHYAATGGLERIRAEHSAYVEGIATMDGLAGRFSQWQGRVLRYRRVEDFSVIHRSFGDTGSFAWEVDTNGKRLIYKDPEVLKRRWLQAWFDDFAHIDTPGDPFTLSYQGIEPAGGAPCHRVTLSNRINSDTTAFFFRSDDLHLARTIHTRPDYRVETDFSDYRVIQGVGHYFRQQSRIFPRDKTETTQITDYRPGVMIDPWLFAPPQKDVSDAAFANGSSARGISFQFIDNTIYLPVTLAGTTTLWILDNGASKTLIDTQAATAMGLKPAGRIRGFGNAEVFDLQFVKLPPMQVGSVSIAPQTVFAFKGLSRRFQTPAVTGILGYDFLSRFVSRIDYAHRSLSLYAPERFVYQGPGRVIQAPLKDRTFTLPITVNGRYPGRWSIDLGAFDMAFHFPFALRHGFLELPGVDRLSAGLGGEVRERTVAFDSISIGGWALDSPLIGVPLQKGQGSQGDGELAGNAGNRLLRHFVLYLDYSRQQLILEKGADFNRRFPRDQSGMQVTEAPGAIARIVFVAQGTPADKAGFRAGDNILSVSGGPQPAPADPSQLEQLLTGPAGTRLQLTVQRGSRHLELELELADLYGGSSEKGDVGP